MFNRLQNRRASSLLGMPRRKFAAGYMIDLNPNSHTPFSISQIGAYLASNISSLLDINVLEVKLNTIQMEGIVKNELAQIFIEVLDDHVILSVRIGDVSKKDIWKPDSLVDMFRPCGRKLWKLLSSVVKEASL